MLLFVAFHFEGYVDFPGDMAHGHSHGGDSKKSKNPNGHKKNEDSVEIADQEYLCADERIAVEGNHGHSHAIGLAESNDDQTTDDETKSKKKKTKKKKEGCKQRFEDSDKRFTDYLVDGGQMNIRGAFLHVLNDALGSVIVVLAGLAMKKWPNETWVNYIDPLASLLMISMIVIFTIPLRK